MNNHTTEEVLFQCLECDEFEINVLHQTLVCWKCIKDWRSRYAAKYIGRVHAYDPDLVK